jgi:GPH family glycoside/pentoside/hexuronide:cation symporter
MQDTKSQPHVVAPEDRVPLRSKIVYGLGVGGDMWGHWLYVGLAYPVFNLYLKVNPLYIGLALMITRLVDAFTDPILARFSDNARTPWGRRRPFILVGSILAGLGLPMLFMASPHWSEKQLFWFILASAMLYAPIMSSYNLPYYSLGAELTPDYHERTSVMSYKAFLQKFIEMPNYFAYRLTQTALFAKGIDAATGNMTYNTMRGAQVVCAVMGGILMIIGFLNFRFVKERYYHKVESLHQKKISVWESFFTTLKCRPFRYVVLIGLAFVLGTSVFGTLGLYTTVWYVAGGNESIGSWWNGWMGVTTMVGALIGVPAINVLSRRLGKRRALMVNLAFGFLAFAATWWLYNPALPWLQLVASGAVGLCGAAIWVMHGSMGADVIDYDEFHTHKRREGAFSACGSWIMKVAIASGMGVSGLVVKLTGFDPMLTQQPADTILKIRVFLGAIPLVGIAIALLMVFLYPLTQERMAEIRVQLEARRGKV